jgi:hypothetical protein
MHSVTVAVDSAKSGLEEALDNQSHRIPERP